MSAPNVPAPTNGPRAVAPAKPHAVLRDMLVRMTDQIAAALPRHMTAERMIRVALTACQRTPKLLECDPTSVVGAVVQAAELGLELSGALGQAYLIPRWNSKTRRHEAQFQCGYKGLLALAYRSADVATFEAHTVHQADHFEYQHGTHPVLNHRPAARDRGPITHVYAVVRLRSGACMFEVMSAEDIDAHRKRYSQAGDSGPWNSAWEEMAKKTVARRLAKWAPLSIEAQRAAALDEYGEAGADQGLPRVEVATADRAALLRSRLAAAEVPAIAETPAPGSPEEGEELERQAKEVFGDAPEKDAPAERQPGEGDPE